MTSPFACAVWATSACAVTFVCVTVIGYPRAAGQEPQPPMSTRREATAVSDLSLIPDFADANVRLDSLADDISRGERTCAAERGR